MPTMAEEKQATTIDISSSKEELTSKEAVGLKASGSVEHLYDVEEMDDDLGVPKWDEEAARAYYQSLEPEALGLLLEKTGHGSSLDDKDHLTPDLLYLLDKLMHMSDDRAIVIFQDTIRDHAEDVNFPADDWTFINSIVNGSEDFYNNPYINFKARLTATLFYYHSPYPEVRSITDVFNTAEEPCETIRSYVIAIIWCIISSGVNEFFSHRQPSIFLYSSVTSILMYPCGKAWEYVMPKVMVPWFTGKIPLNPGPYTFKEQMFATILSAVSGTSIYVSYNIVTQKMFYKQTWVSFGFQILLALSTQCLGLGFAGIMRKFVIYPVRAVWPTMLPTIALNRALLKPERKELIHGWKISKYNFFWITFGSMFVYFWIPDYLFQALSTFNWMTWTSPTNFNLAMVTGSVSGLGFNPIPSFDWNVASALFKPLATPVTTVVNYFLGTFVGFFIILGVYYSNVLWTAYLPINSNGIFTNTAESFDVTEILTNNLLDNDKYQQYSPPFYSAANLVLYGSFFLVYPLTFVYNTYKEWTTISAAIKMMYDESLALVKNFTVKNFIKSDETSYAKFHDAHSKMMRRYKEVPDWYYGIVLIISFVFAIILVKVYPEVETPVWGLFFVVAINFACLIPFSVLFAVTGGQLGLNVLVELIIGYALPGNGNALMTLKAYGYNIDGQADNFLSSLKVGHYAKIPPRSVFRAQIVGTIIQAFVALAVINWSVSNIEDYCETTQAQKFTCPNERTYYSASVFWGVIGPKIVFSGIYPAMKWCFLIGFLAALLFIALHRWGSKTSWFKYISWFEPSLFIFGILNFYAPYNMAYIIPGLYVTLAFLWFIKKRYLSWFEKYNYVLSAGLDAGVAFSAVIIFFAVQYHAKDVNWWGNEVSYAGVDGGVGQVSLYDITQTVRGYFGPEKGNYPTA